MRMIELGISRSPCAVAQVRYRASFDPPPDSSEFHPLRR